MRREGHARLCTCIAALRLMSGMCSVWTMWKVHWCKHCAYSAWPDRNSSCTHQGVATAQTRVPQLKGRIPAGRDEQAPLCKPFQAPHRAAVGADAQRGLTVEVVPAYRHHIALARQLKVYGNALQPRVSRLGCYGGKLACSGGQGARVNRLICRACRTSKPATRSSHR